MNSNSYRTDGAELAFNGVLDELEDYLERRQDIRDGGDGQQLPNEEMRLLSDLRWWRPKLKNVAPQPPVTPHRSMPGLGASPDSANGDTSRQPCETGSGDMAAGAASPGPNDEAKDAARYRWLRDNYGVVSDPDGAHTYYLMSKLEPLDAAIDAACGATNNEWSKT